MNSSGVKMYEDDFTLINADIFLFSNEPYLLASQVQHVFYVKNPLEKNWHAILNTT